MIDIENIANQQSKSGLAKDRRVVRGRMVVQRVGLLSLIVFFSACDDADSIKKLKVSPLQVSKLLDKNIESNTNWLAQGASDIFDDAMVDELANGVGHRFLDGCTSSDLAVSSTNEIFPVAQSSNEANNELAITQESSTPLLSDSFDLQKKDDVRSFMEGFKDHLAKNFSTEWGESDDKGTTVFYDLTPDRICGTNEQCRRLLSSEPFFVRVIRPKNLDLEGYDSRSNEALILYLDHGSRDEAKNIATITLTNRQVSIELDISVWGDLVIDIAKRDFDLSDKIIDRLNATQTEGFYRLILSGSEDGDFNVALSSSDIVFGTKDSTFTSGKIQGDLQFRRGSKDRERLITARFDSAGMQLGLKLKSLCEKASEAGFSAMIVEECRNAQVDDDIATISGLNLGFSLNLSEDNLSISDFQFGDLALLKLLGKNILSIVASDESSINQAVGDGKTHERSIGIHAKLSEETISGRSVPYMRITAEEGFGIDANVNIENLPQPFLETIESIGSDLGGVFHFLFTGDAGVDFSMPLACAESDSANNYPVIIRSGGTYSQTSKSEQEGVDPGRIEADTGPVCSVNLFEEPGFLTTSADTSSACEVWQNND